MRVQADGELAMYKIDPGRTDLAEEFRRNPFGPHSAELQKVLNVMRWEPSKASTSWSTRCLTRSGASPSFRESAECR